MEVNILDWGKIIINGIVIAIIGLIAAIMTQVIADFKGYRKIADKIGNHKSDTLEGQHEEIEKVVKDSIHNAKELITKDTSMIYFKVEKIGDIALRNENLYQNLNLSQKEVKDNAAKLVFDWESTIEENKKLKDRIVVLERKNRELEGKYNDLKNKYKKVRVRKEEKEL